MPRSSLVVLAVMALGCRANRETTRVPESTIVDAGTAMAAPKVIELALETGWGCALRSDGSVHCWGQGDPGQIVGLRSPRSRWEIAGVLEGLQAVDIATSRDRLCAVQRDGTVRCLDVRDRVLTGDEVDELTDIVEVEVGDFVCTRSKKGAVHCIDPSPRPGDSYIREVASDIRDLAVDNSLGCALDAVGMVSCWTMKRHEIEEAGKGTQRIPSGMNPQPMSRVAGASTFASFSLIDGRPRPCVAHDSKISCMRESEDYEFELVTGLERVSAFAGSPESNCAIHSSGELTCGGDNWWAQIGDGSSITTPGRFEITGLAEPEIVAKSASYTCAAAGVKVWCWGTRLSVDDDPPVIETHRYALNATGIAVDEALSCASTESDGLLCWGMPDEHLPPEGILGVARLRPIDLDIGPLKKMQAGCLLDQSGELICGRFGLDTFTPDHRASGIADFTQAESASCWIRRGALECFDHFGGRRKRHIPKLRGPVALAGLGSLICVVHDTGEASCFTPFSSDRGPWHAPLRVGTLTDLVAIRSAGFGEFAALDARGTLWQWGYRLRDDIFAIQELEVRSVEVDEIAQADRGLCVRLDERIWCDRIAPDEDELEDIVQMAGGRDFFCVRHGDGSVTCRGHNRYGQLGSPPGTVMLEPTAIVFEQ